MRKLTRLTAASVATLTLTAGSFAAFAAAHHASTGSGSAANSYRHEASGTEKSAAQQQARHEASGSEKKVAAGARTASAAQAAKWTARDVQYPKTVTLHDLKIPMDDGVVLRGDLTLPADADGKAIDKKFPVIATITAYNKGVQQYAGGLAGGDPKYLVQRGYAQLTVDARGTGTSAGQWCAFCSREDKDFGEVMQWAHEQSWSNGLTAMDGPSYMGIAQMFAAAAQPDGLKAIFPQVPAADVYRDVVASGGQIDIGFIPLWLGLVTVTGLIPPTAPPSDASPLMALAQHLAGAGTFTLPLILKAFAGQEPAYDGPFYAQRSPINVVNKVNVPTFFVSGEYDLFQRGTPLLFENLQKRGIPTKLIIGPWNHLQASGGGEVAKAGLGSLDELKLRWFDHYVKGIADPTLDSDIPPMTYYEQGTGAWKSGAGWMKDRSAATYKLSGTSKTAGAAGSLTTGAVTAGSSSVYPIPVSGLCTRSTDQWTAGLMSEFPFPNPCNTDNKWNDKTGVVFSTAPVTKAVTLQGPINARLYVSSNSGDGMLSVAVEDEAPDGTVSRLSGGWQVISQRALNTAKSRYLDGQLIQPYHPFTKASKKLLPKGSVAPVDVEIFPTGAKILPGHRLRIAVQAFDIPHLSPILPDLLSTLTVIKIFNSAQYPSRITLPLVD
ncbi:CocE/NonD family hydrolase [Nocardioides marmorisolisilvae]|uniref:CocE/NonD family hydrolase n=1 Tax=Nocardioides marmorisolisilvae TaxID=1542737 RepID=A0A3N0DPZ4_9ACTN|nr:CocE/NonD family hydrolase [Nocardioides marmorisolisilvae]RNL77720.1 CocE/NonD family hydrolase [Nocardioides marmorisolisilvae]